MKITTPYGSMTASQANTHSVPVLWQLELSHYNEKVRWALDYKRVPHVRRSLLPGLHAVEAKRLTGDISTTPVLTVDGRSIGDSTRIIAEVEERWPQPPLYPADGFRRASWRAEAGTTTSLPPRAPPLVERLVQLTDDPVALADVGDLLASGALSRSLSPSRA